MVKIELKGTHEEFKAKLKEHAKVVVDFTATWCPPCRMIKPKLIALEESFESITLIICDVDECAEVAENENISAMPTIKFFHNGVKVGEVVGASEEKIKGEFEKLAAL